MRKNRVRGGSAQEKAKYGAPRAPERAPFKGRVDGSSPHPSLEGQGEGRGAHSVLSSDVLEWYVFPVSYVFFINMSWYIWDSDVVWC